MAARRMSRKQSLQLLPLSQSAGRGQDPPGESRTLLHQVWPGHWQGLIHFIFNIFPTDQNLQDVSDKAWDLYEELNEFRHLEGRETSMSLRDVYWDFVDEALEEEEDKDDLELCMGGLSLALSGKFILNVFTVNVSGLSRLRL